MLEGVMPYLLRPPTDQEQRLGIGLIEHLQLLGGQGLTDSTAEVAIAVMLALYANHRREMSPSDTQALDRILDAARKIHGQHRDLVLRTGDDFKRAVVSLHEAGKLS